MSVYYQEKYYTQISENLLFTQSRAFEYGDGFFETMLYAKHQIRFLEDHLQRIEKACHALKMYLTIPLEKLKEILFEVVAQQKEQDKVYRIKIVFWRKQGGLYTPQSNEADFLIKIVEQNLSSISTPCNKVSFVSDVGLCASPFSPFKTINALPYVMAGLFKKQNELDEVILLNVHHHVAECLASNVFWIENNIFYTPSLASGCVEGVMRKQVIQMIAQQKWICEEGSYTKENILKADAVFSCNVAGVKAINRIEETTFATHPYIQSIQKILNIQ